MHIILFYLILINEYLYLFVSGIKKSGSEVARFCGLFREKALMTFLRT
jgi:hypothetical protein